MKQKSFLKRLVVSYLVIAILPLAIIIAVYFVNTLEAEKKTASQKLMSATELVSAQFDSLLTNMSFLSTNLLSNDNFTKAANGLGLEGSSGLQQQAYYQEISSEICTYAIFASLYDVSFFNDKGYFVTSSNYNRGYNYKYRMSREMLQEIPWYQKVQNNYGKEIVEPIQESILGIEGRKSLSLVRAIRNPGEIVGYLSVEVDMEKLGYLLEIDEAMEAETLIVRDDGVILYCSQGLRKHLGETRSFLAENREQLGQRYFLGEHTQASTGITVLMAAEKSRIYANATRTLQVLGLEGLGLLLLTLVVIVVFSKDLAKPLLALQEEMKETTLENLQAQGNAQLFYQYREIAYVYQQFHKMRERLNVMIQKEMAIQKLYLEERMNYLQAQINPHFMCNTLNVIGIMGSENGVQEVYNACLQLSSILQYSIGDKAEGNCTIFDEMENIRDYLELMRLRYEYKLQYTIFCQEGMEKFSIPRLVLEPFVENIFVHAYGPQNRIVQVNVTGYIQRERWYLVIEDNGRGMEEEKLAKLKQHMDACCRQLLLGKRVNKEYGIGIENTMMRLCLYYNEAFTYSLENRTDGGFRITLSSHVEGKDECGKA
ncbi:MAG: histidine kinase [Lachnospiraceae bacterium]|nr:histidine kinase [Lachnospiraceae bacterium]